MENIFADNTSVSMTIAKIDNKKITKTIFNQLNIWNPFKAQFIFTGDKILGYVNSNGIWIIYIINDKIFKCFERDLFLPNRNSFIFDDLGILFDPTEKKEFIEKNKIKLQELREMNDDFLFNKSTTSIDELVTAYNRAEENRSKLLEQLKKRQIFL